MHKGLNFLQLGCARPCTRPARADVVQPLSCSSMPRCARVPVCQEVEGTHVRRARVPCKHCMQRKSRCSITCHRLPFAANILMVKLLLREYYDVDRKKSQTETENNRLRAAWKLNPPGLPDAEAQRSPLHTTDKHAPRHARTAFRRQRLPMPAPSAPAGCTLL
jgi:hypothetical protein